MIFSVIVIKVMKVLLSEEEKTKVCLNFVIIVNVTGLMKTIIFKIWGRTYQ